MTPNTRHAATAATARPQAETLTNNWMNRAACTNRPENWWDGDKPKLTEKARAVCLSCPVLTECLSEQMVREGSWSRSVIRGGLTGPERTQLCIDAQMDGPYDAEEARLLALEAGAYGKPVRDIAGDDVSGSTVRMAARMAGERVPNRQLVAAERGTAVDKAVQNADHIMTWRESGLSRQAIASRLGVGRSAVDVVVRKYSAAAGVQAEPAVGGESAEEALLDAYLAGQSLRLTHEQLLAAIGRGLARGMNYRDIDRVQGLAAHTTAQFVCRQRKRFERDGREFPVLAVRNVSLTDRQVLEARERYAAGGITDMELAMRYGVPRNVMSHALNGRNYKHVGGPIRRGRSEASMQASKAWNDEVCRGAFAAGRINKERKAA